MDRQDQKLLAKWAADCAEHVLQYFESEHPQDKRPREAIVALRAWAQNDQKLGMAIVRALSLGSHAAARAAKTDTAKFAARAAGQAIATWHVPSHAIGAAWYGAKATDAASKTGEREWQYRRLPKHLRPFILQLAKKRPALAKVLQYEGMI